MKTKIFTSVALLLMAQVSFAQVACEREDLSSSVDDFFNALALHDTSAVALSRNVKSTENNLPTNVGEGFWETAGEIVFSRNVLDTESCSTVTQAVIKENGRNILYGVRLKMDFNMQISEIEHIIAREEEFAFKPQGVLDTSDVDWEVLLEPEEKTSRMAMRAAANDYFDMFVEIPEVSAPFAGVCDRWENGTKTTRNGDCSPKGLVIVHGGRRVPVVDRETGVAVTFIHFASSLPDMHMFKFRNGKVELVQAVIGKGNGTPDMGWPDDTSLSRRIPPQGEVLSAPLNVGN